MIDGDYADEDEDDDDIGDELAADLAAMFAGSELEHGPTQGSRKPMAAGLLECPFTPCPDCGGPVTQVNGYFNAAVKECPTCDGIGYLDVPTDNSLFERHRPGSEVRVAMMTARASIGLDLWSGRNPFAYRSGDAH